MLRIKIVFTFSIIVSFGFAVRAADENTDAATTEALVTYSHFKATYDSKSSAPIVTIKFNPKAEFDPGVFKNVKIAHPEESKWMFMKQLIVNELFGMSKQNTGFLVQNRGIEKWYLMVMSNRGFDKEAIKNASLNEKIVWLLKEIVSIEPDPLTISLYVELHPNTNKQYYFSHLFRIATVSVVNVADVSELLYNQQNKELFIQAIFRELLPMIREIKSKEFEKYLDKYVPYAIRYIVKVVSAWPKQRKWEPDVFAVCNYIVFPTTDGDEDKLFADNPTYRVFGKKKKKKNAGKEAEL